MNIYPYIVLGFGVIALVLFLVLRDRKGSIEAMLLKTITSFLFISVAFTSFMINMNSSITHYFMLVMMGLICGLIGDIVLDMKIIYKESSSIYQHAGMVAFLIGHLFYLGALFVYYGFHWLPLVIAIVITVIIILVSKFVLKFDFKEHTVDSYLYSFFLTYMMTQACYAAITTGFATTTILLSIGAVLFLLSDLVLVMTYYDNKDSRPFIITNHVLYYGAQYLIALSVLYMTA